MEIAVISGKGGTGKSSISAAFASVHDKIVLADCDVDAANLYIIFEPKITEKSSFIGAQKAEIDYSKSLVSTKKNLVLIDYTFDFHIVLCQFCQITR